MIDRLECLIMKTPEQYCDRLRDAGLVVSKPYISNHVAFPDGIVVGKPITVAGNSIPGTQTAWGKTGVIVDAPCPILHHDAGKWIVTVNTYIPGPGPGDFVNVWDTPEEAIADILDYLLGDPARMAVKQEAREAFLASFDSPDDEDSDTG